MGAGGGGRPGRNAGAGGGDTRHAPLYHLAPRDHDAAGDDCAGAHSHSNAWHTISARAQNSAQFSPTSSAPQTRLKAAELGVSSSLPSLPLSKRATVTLDYTTRTVPRPGHDSQQLQRVLERELRDVRAEVVEDRRRLAFVAYCAPPGVRRQRSGGESSACAASPRAAINASSAR